LKQNIIKIKEIGILRLILKKKQEILEQNFIIRWIKGTSYIIFNLSNDNDSDCP